MIAPGRVLLAAGLATAVVSCGSPRRSAPILGEPSYPSPPVARGAVEYDKHCSRCHPGGEGGLGPALNDKPLPPDAIELQVRKGLGPMPAFSHEELSEERLDAIVAYLLWLRERG